MNPRKKARLFWRLFLGSACLLFLAASAVRGPNYDVAICVALVGMVAGSLLGMIERLEDRIEAIETKQNDKGQTVNE